MEFIQDDIIIRSNMASYIAGENDENEIITDYLIKFNDSDNLMAAALEYIHQLDNYDKTGLALSIQLLKTSFDLFKSNGFVVWEKKVSQKEKIN